MYLELRNLLLQEIKSKNQIKELKDEFILSRLEQFFLTHGDKRKKLEYEFNLKKGKVIKSKIFKEILKSLREEIGILYGSYLTSSFQKKEKLLEKDEEIEKLLSLHKSSKERLEYYYQIYKKIFEWYQPKKGISDLACGLNPLNYEEIIKVLGFEVPYYASDLNPKDMKFIEKFFEKHKINGKAMAYDITSLEFLKDSKFQETDLVFFLKALDSFETIKKDSSKEILEKIPQKHVVVSFPTKSLLSKKEVKSEKRNWLRNWLRKKEWNWNEFEVDNEMFFLIKKERP